MDVSSDEANWGMAPSSSSTGKGTALDDQEPLANPSGLEVCGGSQPVVNGNAYESAPSEVEEEGELPGRSSYVGSKVSPADVSDAALFLSFSEEARRQQEGLGASRTPDESTDEGLPAEEAAVEKMYQALMPPIDVQFGYLQIQTSNIKLSFTFGKAGHREAVKIDQMCSHLEKGETYEFEDCDVLVKDKSETKNHEGRTYFGGVCTITMEVWPKGAGFMEDTTHRGPGSRSCSVRLFGFKDTDPEKRHKAQFNGVVRSHHDTLCFFRQVFEHALPMSELKVEPNGVFCATDNAVLDPHYGFKMEELQRCLDIHASTTSTSKVTGAINFTFTDSRGRKCKPTVQKSGRSLICWLCVSSCGF
jgi:hypothetical protein